MSMKEFAEHVIAVAEKSEKRITNLQLQKIMYFAIGDFISEFGITRELKKMYDEPFEAWTYGPVVRSEYFRYRNYGSFSIREPGIYRPQYELFNKYIHKYMTKNINRLVEESHNHSTWWKNSEKILRNQVVKYRLEDLQHDFSV
ncbi:Panacea domain-containing protein [Paenibacillus koleovorans]|uniref:Panacea domain-containing protein n=1 Tax=Paenibacillus koleovorans TaxID=121608 RepID=UPI000FD97C60|nr:type II toxin-antitoxin system antitoxin SocA domain-containing protein [Paenibacillus koleovorans]